MKKRLGLFIVLVWAFAQTANAVSPESLTYAYAGNTAIYTAYIDRTGGNISTVCPDYFEIDGFGNLVLTAKVSRTFVQNMHDRGVKVTPFLSNHWNRDNARLGLANRAALANQLAEAVRAFDLDGVDVDLENINHDDRANYTDFIRRLRLELGPQKILSVCVAANPWGTSIGWQGAYDYEALLPYIDHIFIMAYDESYSGGPAGPVASYSFARKSVEYALKKLPPEKVMLGVPFYGRYWKAGAASGGLALTVSDIEGLVSRYKSALWYDAENEGARATLTLTEGDVSAGLWGGKKLTAGVYDLWYENERSLQKKLSLVRELGIKGAGSWAIGQEPVRFWEAYRGWLAGLPFSDIYGHWAERYIVRLSELELVSGFPSGKFQPESGITRAEALKLILGLAEVPALKAPSAFSDTADHWADAWINTAARLGLVFGSGDGRFRPDDKMTRAEFSVLLARVMYFPNTMDFNEPHYKDVSPGLLPWGNNAIVSLKVHGVLSEAPDGYFHPYRHISRAEAAKMIAGALDLPHGLPPAALSRGRSSESVPPVIEPR